MILNSQKMDHLCMSYAKYEDGQIITTISGAKRLKTFCIACNESVHFVKEHARKHPSKDEKIIVRAHFRHTNKIQVSEAFLRQHRPESIAHQAAKQTLVAANFHFSIRCGCGKILPIKLGGERRVEVSYDKYRLDVAYMNGGTVVGGVEVLHSSRVSDEKFRFLGKNIPWCEVKAKKVLKSTGHIFAERSHNQVCGSCKRIEICRVNARARQMQLDKEREERKKIEEERRILIQKEEERIAEEKLKAWEEQVRVEREKREEQQRIIREWKQGQQRVESEKWRRFREEGRKERDRIEKEAEAKRMQEEKEWLASDKSRITFQHTACSLDVHSSTLTLYGRTNEGSVAIHTKIEPHLICGKDPRYITAEAVSKYNERGYPAQYSQLPAIPETATVRVIKGNNIAEWGPRVFYKVYFKNVIDFFRSRKMLRKQAVPMFNDQVGLDSQWFIQKGLRPCSLFEVQVNSHKVRRTFCDAEYWMRLIKPAKGYIEPVLLSYDIECLLRPGVFPDPKRDPVITIGCYTKKESKCFCLQETPGYDSFPTEEAMIKAFLRYVQRVSPDILTGYNVNRFDNTYIETRCKKLGIRFKWSRMRGYVSTIKHITTHSNQKGTQEQYRLDIPGVVVMDGYEVMRAQHNLSKYSLEAVCQKFLNTGKDDMPYHLIPEKFKTPEGRTQLADYCVKDCKLVVDLFDKLKKVVNLVQMGQVTGCFAVDILNRGQGIRTITLMQYYCKEKHIFIPRTDKASDGFKGAVVLPPKKGMYKDAVICVDFASLYPSIMRALNMCYSTLVTNDEIEKNGWVEGEDVRTVPDYEWVDGRLKVTHNPDNCSFLTTKIRQGILPLMLATMYNERKRVKKEMKKQYGTDDYAVLDGKQLALKVVMNSVYGFTGAKKGYLPEPRIASSVTKYGRGLTLRTMDSVNNNPAWKGSEVIYGDSVAEDTPIMVRIKGAFEIMQISELTDKYDTYKDKEACELEDMEVWSDAGWTKIHRVIRHKVHKKMYRVWTEDASVDVTEDHSMLKGDGTPVKPTECTRDLLHAEYPEFPDTYSPLNYWDAWWWGVSLGRRKCTYGVEYEEWKIPTFILLSPQRVIHGFFEGLCSTGNNKERARRIIKSKENALRYQFLIHRLGMKSALSKHTHGFRVSFRTKEARQKFGIEELPAGGWVYDLTTDNHHFAVGPGKLVVHNTDSCFVRLSREFCDGNNEEELIQNAHKQGEIMASDITQMFLKPVLMEYEKAYAPPFVLYMRKRYFGKKHEPGKNMEIDIKGFECIRRDFCPMVIKTQRHLIGLVLDWKIDEGVSYVQGVMKKLYAGQIPVDDLVMSKKLSQKPEHYKTTAPHVELAKRLNGKYQAGERVEYFIRAGREPLNQRAIERAELSKYPLDFTYYAEKQLWKPIQRIMDLVVGRNVFRRRAITAPKQAGSMLKFVKVLDRRKKRKIDDNISIFKQVTPADIRSFFG